MYCYHVCLLDMCYQQSPFKANGLFSQIVCPNDDPPLPLLSPTSLHSLGRVWRDQVNFSINSFQFSKMSGHLGARFVADDSLWDHFDNIVIHYVEFQKCWPFLRIWLAAWTCWHGWCVSAGAKTWPWSKHPSELYEIGKYCPSSWWDSPKIEIPFITFIIILMW